MLLLLSKFYIKKKKKCIPYVTSVKLVFSSVIEQPPSPTAADLIPQLGNAEPHLEPPEISKKSSEQSSSTTGSIIIPRTSRKGQVLSKQKPKIRKSQKENVDPISRKRKLNHTTKPAKRQRRVSKKKSDPNFEYN